MTALLIYKRYFPHLTPNLFQQDKLEQLVTDLERWDATCEFWILNDYRGQSIGKMIGYYNDLVSGAVRNGKPRAAWQDVGRAVAGESVDTFDESSLLCDVCGKECCLQLHRDERLNAI